VRSLPIFLRDAGVIVVRTFRQRLGVHVRGQRVGGALEQCDIGLSDQFGRRRREVARVAGVQGRRVGRLKDQAEARTQLALLDVGVDLVAAHAVVHRQLVAELPFVLQVEAVGPRGDVRGVVDDGDRCGTGLVAVGVGREHQRGCCWRADAPR